MIALTLDLACGLTLAVYARFLVVSSRRAQFLDATRPTAADVAAAEAELMPAGFDLGRVA